MKSITLVIQNLLKPYIDRKDRATQANIAPVETDATSASKAYSVGAQLILNDVLYDVTAPIAQNDALTVGTNIAAADDITTQIQNHTVTTDAVPTKNSTNPVQSDGVYNSEKATREIIAPVEEDATSASQAYAQGTQLILNGVLYDVTAPIAQNDALVVGTNIAAADDVVTQLVSKAAGTDLTTLSGKAYQTDDTTENSLASDDILPFYDTSATAKRKMPVQKFAEQLISNPNLLDNPWFTVNQRGLSTYDGTVANQFTVDRWKNVVDNRGTVTVTNDGITFTANSSAATPFIRQQTEISKLSLIGKSITLSLMLADGTIISNSAVVTSADNTNTPVVMAETDDELLEVSLLEQSTHELFVNIRKSYDSEKPSVNIRAVKLELGSVSTLAMDTAPNYATELLKCQRYFINFNPNKVTYCPLGHAASKSDRVYLDVSLPVSMRANPSITIDTSIDFCGAGSVIAVSTYTPSLYKNCGNIIRIQILVSNVTLADGQIYSLNFKNNVGTFTLSADL